MQETNFKGQGQGAKGTHAESANITAKTVRRTKAKKTTTTVTKILILTLSEATLTFKPQY